MLPSVVNHTLLCWHPAPFNQAHHWHMTWQCCSHQWDQRQLLLSPPTSLPSQPRPPAAPPTQPAAPPTPGPHPLPEVLAQPAAALPQLQPLPAPLRHQRYLLTIPVARSTSPQQHHRRHGGEEEGRWAGWHQPCVSCLYVGACCHALRQQGANTAVLPLPLLWLPQLLRPILSPLPCILPPPSLRLPQPPPPTPKARLTQQGRG